MDYDYFRRFQKYGLINPIPNSITSSLTPYSHVYNFKSYVKFEPTLFPRFKYQALWENWNFNIIENSCTQYVEDICNEYYIPSTTDGNGIFTGG